VPIHVAKFNVRLLDRYTLFNALNDGFSCETEVPTTLTTIGTMRIGNKVQEGMERIGMGNIKKDREKRNT